MLATHRQRTVPFLPYASKYLPDQPQPSLGCVDNDHEQQAEQQLSHQLKRFLHPCSSIPPVGGLRALFLENQKIKIRSYSILTSLKNRLVFYVMVS
jgi:hypothetical protein